MPKNKFQDVIFTIIMVFVMVYVMICYNIALNIGGMKNEVFLSAFHELVIMGPLAFIVYDRACNFCRIDHRYVSADEPGCDPAFQKCRKSVYCRMA